MHTQLRALHEQALELTRSTAKYLDQIKSERFPVEVLVRGKDAAENEKLFVKVAEIIKNAGVSHNPVHRGLIASTAH